MDEKPATLTDPAFVEWLGARAPMFPTLRAVDRLALIHRYKAGEPAKPTDVVRATTPLRPAPTAMTPALSQLSPERKLATLDGVRALAETETRIASLKNATGGSAKTQIERAYAIAQQEKRADAIRARYRLK